MAEPGLPVHDGPGRYWGAKLVASFTEAHIRAAVRQGRLPPAAEDTVVRILVGRRDKTVAHLFGRVTPLEEVAVEPAADREPPGASAARGRGPAARGFAVTFEDLGTRGKIWTPQETSYRWCFEHPAHGLRWEGEAERYVAAGLEH